jgi:predicted Fe-S protein YdhL (DUF1289 family)
VQGVHTRVIEILCEASARSALELCFEFREERARWAHHNHSQTHKREIVQGVHIRVVEHSEEDSAREGTPELLNTLRKKALQGVH